MSVATERKKLTIFFSDIKDFTATTERLQPEELTALLNEYLTEMTAIAQKHGGTVDKYIGDAILVFFGDPETKGVREDAQACVRMAVEMQKRLGQLNARWRRAGIERPFQARIGINTGYCNVGNFGSDDRMDYTIIGAEANLAARLQSVAAPGGITLSYETYALVSDIVRASPQDPIRMKGISRDVVPYAIEGDLAAEAAETVFSEHARGIDFYIDVDALEAEGAARLRKRLLETLAAVDRRMTGAGAPGAGAEAGRAAVRSGLTVPGGAGTGSRSGRGPGGPARRVGARGLRPGGDRGAPGPAARGRRGRVGHGRLVDLRRLGPQHAAVALHRARGAERDDPRAGRDRAGGPGVRPDRPGRRARRLRGHAPRRRAGRVRAVPEPDTGRGFPGLHPARRAVGLRHAGAPARVTKRARPRAAAAATACPRRPFRDHAPRMVHPRAPLPAPPRPDGRRGVTHKRAE